MAKWSKMVDIGVDLLGAKNDSTITLQLFYAKNAQILNIQKMTRFWKVQNWSFCKGYSKTKSSKLTLLVAEF